MDSNFVTIFLGFIEGFGLIISPCILPILPVFLAASLTGSKKRPIGMIIGFTFFFALLIFFSRQLVNYLGINFEVIRSMGYIFLLLFGLIMLSDYLTEQFSRITQKLAQVGSIFSSLNKAEGGFFNGILLGGLIAIIWTPCAGPILAAIIVQTVVQKTTLLSFFTLLAFALGAVIPLFILSLYGKKIMSTFIFFKTRAALFRKLLGAILIASVVYMIYFENTSASTTISTGVKTSNALIDGLWRPYPEPQIAGIATWINSGPLRLNDLQGKVVLVDFWTYSCINCLRTLPYIKAWYNRYHDKGLVIIGVHTPEFDFEKDVGNVRAAVQRDGILYPVALDNQYNTWINFNNHYWPAHYLINKKGEVVYEHFGEGDYDVTENNIRYLLGINELTTLKNEPAHAAQASQTPETYLGYERADSNFSPKLIKNKVFQYQFPLQLVENGWALNGAWQVNADSITAAKASAALKIHFNARKVFLVMGTSTGKAIKVNVVLNHNRIKNILVDKYSIYEVVTQAQFSSGDLEIIATEPGIKIYTFTFGS
ncbi:cytochrome c biogenesis protein DipZ [Legionella rowbothamii]|uniref:cytochrome c biogenesis protein DipZ n=1 Tax=Legionella rowbothamii TaxID=96229 RepID=UPI0010547676|nr:cytochrome c biogenesis protein DipZ [Legionella rowbothamii]